MEPFKMIEVRGSKYTKGPKYDSSYRFRLPVIEGDIIQLLTLEKETIWIYQPENM